MGQRANFVIIRDGEAKGYYAQWGALGCVYEFAVGPEHATRSAEHFEPTTELLDWAFAEGGYLIDFDEKQAIAFGYTPDEMDFEDFEGIDEDQVNEAMALEAALQEGPEAFLKLIAPRWSGWLLHWDDRGVDAFSDHLKRRGIRSVVCQPPRDPSYREKYSYQA